MTQDNANDRENFFYNAGISLGEHFGGKSMAFRHKIINQFHSFVQTFGGADRFVSSEDAVRHYLRKTKGGSRAFSKH